MDMSSALALLDGLNSNGKRLLEALSDNSTASTYHGQSSRTSPNAVPSARMFTQDEPCEVLPTPLRDYLTKIYFLHVHPLCPIVDEFDWYEYYDNLKDEDELKMHDNLILFQAMMFAALAVSLIPLADGNEHSVNGSNNSTSPKHYLLGPTIQLFMMRKKRNLKR